MKNRIEVTAKTVDEAIAEALEKLEVSRDQVDVEIIEEDKKGFLGLGGAPARVVVSLKSDPVNTAVRFLSEMMEKAGVKAEIDANLEDKYLNINMSGDNIGVFIGKRGQTLDALQYLLNMAVNKNAENYITRTL